MSKRRMLKLFEKNGRGRSGLAAALPVQPHSQSASLFLDESATALYRNPGQRG